MNAAYQATDRRTGQNVLVILTDGQAINPNRYARPRLLGFFHGVHQPKQFTPIQILVRNRAGRSRLLEISQPNPDRQLFYARSESGEKYIVQQASQPGGLRDGAWYCDCKDFVIRGLVSGQTCYHIDGVQQAIEQQ